MRPKHSRRRGCFNATGFDTDFLERERIGQSQAGIFAMRDDAKNQYAATLAQVQGIPFTVAIAHEAVSVGAFDRAGIDVSINPRAVTAEEIVRFAHDPRTQQVAMIEGNRYEVLDVTTRESSATSAWRSATCRCMARSSERSSATEARSSRTAATSCRPATA